MDGLNTQMLASLSSIIVALLYWSLNRNIAALDREIEKIQEHAEDQSDSITNIRERIIVLEQKNSRRS